MSKINVRMKYSHQWQTQKEFCKRVARMSAALIENASDPFHYIRTLNLLQRGIENAEELNDVVNRRVATLSNSQLAAMNGRVGFIMTSNKEKEFRGTLANA